MCARFTLRTHPSEWVRILGAVMPVHPLGANVPTKPRYNIAPTQTVFAFICDDEDTATPMPLRWGLLPPWANELSVGNRMINARGETVAEKPAFRKAFRERRCVIPADGYYEWTQESDGKQPHLIHRHADAPFFMAGLWERNAKLAKTVAEKGFDPFFEPTINSCTIITTIANRITSAVHDRMPVILDAEESRQWLIQGGESILQPADDSLLNVRPVSRRVSSVRNDDPQCMDPAPRQGELF